MAMDIFKEETVVKHHSGLNNVLYYLSWIMIVLFGLFGVMNLYSLLGLIGTPDFSWPALIFSLVLIGIAVLLFIRKDTLRVEYDYTFTNGVFDIHMALNNRKNKYLTQIELKTVESAGKVTNPAFQRYLSRKDIKKHNWFLNREADLVYLFFTKNAVKHLVIIEPSPDMQQLIRTKGGLGFGVWQE